MTATVVRVRKTIGNRDVDTETAVTGTAEHSKEQRIDPLASIPGHPDTVYGAHNTQMRIASDTADNILWSKYANHTAKITSPLPPQVRTSLWRVSFGEVSSPMPLRSVIQRASADSEAVPHASLLIVTGRSRRLATESHRAELDSIIAEQGLPSINSDVAKTLGEVAAGLIFTTNNASGILVVQAANSSP